MIKILKIALLMIFLSSCQNQISNSIALEQEPSILVKQNTVVTLEGMRIGNGNYFTRDYKLPDGTQKNGLSARLWFRDGSQTVVGLGSTFKVKTTTYEVLEIKKQYQDKGYGFMRLREIKE